MHEVVLFRCFVSDPTTEEYFVPFQSYLNHPRLSSYLSFFSPTAQAKSCPASADSTRTRPVPLYHERLMLYPPSSLPYSSPHLHKRCSLSRLLATPPHLPASASKTKKKGRVSEDKRFVHHRSARVRRARRHGWMSASQQRRHTAAEHNRRPLLAKKQQRFHACT